MSHPVWVRGLKQHTLGRHVPRQRVALCVGAWIETSMITMQGTTQNVEPCVVRGLKQKIDATCSRCTWPHPVWVRGLKPAECGK